MLRSASMKRFYLAVPVEYEEENTRKIGEPDAVQLTSEILVGHDEKVKLCMQQPMLYIGLHPSKIGIFQAIHKERAKIELGR